MDYIAALRLVHEILRPATYCEIGCREGHSLTLAQAPAIGIDPDFEIKMPFAAPTRLFKMTSDAFFAQRDIVQILGARIDFAFIDGMHRVEFALRDFMNLEKHARPDGVIAIDDLLPQHIDYATRDRNTQIWTGDVYRLIPILRQYRPDLDIRVYDIEMKGFGLVSGLDPTSTVLADNYASIEGEIADGNWSLPTADAIRERTQPRATDMLAQDLRTLAGRRARAIAQHESSKIHSLYLELLKRSILNETYLDDELRILYLRSCLDGKETFRLPVLHDIRNARRDDYEKLAASRKIGRFFDRKIQNCGFSHSMMGRARIDSLHAAMDIVRAENIIGDVVECGVWRGGGCIFMAGYLRAFGMADRKVVVADSFEGLPASSLPQDAGLDLSKEKYPELAVSLDTVRENFAVYGLDTPNVVFLKGWFKDTLPDAPTEMIALLRLDGDLYESTMDILNALYDRVVLGGIVIVDDYNAIPACRQAVADFFVGRALALPEMQEIDWTGVWFRKAGEQPGLPAPSIRPRRSPRLSVVICAYEMQREAPRTILSSALPYQEDVQSEDYEVIVVDNGSRTPLTCEHLPDGVSIVRMPSPQPSPVFALNWAAREVARGDILLFAIDGARIFSKRLFTETMKAHEFVSDAFVFSLAWHIGPKVQMQSVPEGYNQRIEDELIAGSGWPEQPDALFDISVFAGSSTPGFFGHIAESNAFSMSRSMFERYGGFDERFVSPGGGLANLEIFHRYVTRPNTRNVCLLSEGTFHQVHDSVATSGKTEFSVFAKEYETIFGRQYVKPVYETLYQGKPRAGMAAFLQQSIGPRSSLAVGGRG